MMLYLLDANVLITANNDYYPIDRIPEFWEWLTYQGSNGKIKMPVEIMDEVMAGREDDLLFGWINESTNQDALLLDEDVDLELVQRVVNDGYASDLTDSEVEELGRDPFLIAYGSVEAERCIVTTEVSKSSKIRQNRKIPDVCNTLGVRCNGPFDLNRDLGFSTSWKR